jgi:hypothetical protein
MRKIIKGQFGTSFPNIITPTKMKSINQGLGVSNSLAN